MPDAQANKFSILLV